jgi:probable phosphoglycerate mutase
MEGRIQGQIDISLDELGLQQAQRVAERLANYPIAAIYSSSLQRASVTANALAEKLSLTVTCDDRLQEYDFGVVSGLTWSEVMANQPQLVERWDDDAWAVPIEGSEGRENFAARVRRSMDDIIARHPDDQVAVVAHGGTFNVYLAKMLGLDLRRRHPFHFGNASVSLLEVRAGVFHVHFLNDNCHTLNGLT